MRECQVPSLRVRMGAPTFKNQEQVNEGKAVKRRPRRWLSEQRCLL